MTKVTTVQLRAPYLILIGDVADETYAKTGFGIVHWRPDLVAGQLRLDGCKINMGVPDMSIGQALEADAKSLLIGVAPIGGSVPDSWLPIIEEAALAGMDIISGLHFKLADIPSIAAAARSSGARLIDVRTPPSDLPVGTGEKRSGKRVLMVGTDCAVGKKYSALALHKAMHEAGVSSTFRATGQTGIMLAGEGIPLDAVVADFISGAAELISPDNDADHWDVIEGQGSLFHPGYSGVSLGLLHGSQPDAIVLCHDAARTMVSGWEHVPLPSLTECIELHIEMGRLANPRIQCVGICVNTSTLKPAYRHQYLEALEAENDLPCLDPMIDGCTSIVEYIKTHFPG